MSPAPVSSQANFLMGLLIGIVLGGLAAIAFTGGKREPAANQQEGHSPDSHAPRSPSEGGPADRAPGSGGAGGDPHGGGGADRAASSAAKSHFMKKFVKALSAPPENKWPNPEYQPLWKEPENPLRCANCHDPQQFNVEGMRALGPGSDKVQRFRSDPRFMVPLMRKWVERLNERHAGRLAKRVGCVDCHAMDPAESWTTLPPIMARFTAALTQKPRNKNPAPGWRPLLRDPSKGVKNCTLCHSGEIAREMDTEAARFLEKPQSKRHLEDKAFMVTLMERWVKKLNTEAASALVKKVTCTDCHAEDPR